MGIWHNPRLLALAANMLLGLGLMLGLFAALSWVASRPYFELRQVQLGPAPGSALRHVNKPTLVEAVRRAPAGNFFTVDMNDIKEAVQEVPWVRKATVRRLWPDTLVVSIEEHRAAALWEDSRLVSVYGELFSANLDEAIEDGPLPQLGGPDGTEGEVMARYIEIKSIVEPLGVSPVAVNLSARRAWTAKLDDGTELLIGKDKGVPIAERLARWAESYPLVAERMQRQASVIDLRYPNGYAVRSLELLADARNFDEAIDDARTVKAGLGSGAGGAAANDAAARPTPVSAPATARKAAPAPKPNKTTRRAPVRTAAARPTTEQKKPSVRKPARTVPRVEAPSKAAPPDADPLAEIRRAATQRARERAAARARAAAQARQKALADKRSSYRPVLGVQPSTMRTAYRGEQATVIKPAQPVGEHA